MLRKAPVPSFSPWSTVTELLLMEAESMLTVCPKTDLSRRPGLFLLIRLRRLRKLYWIFRVMAQDRVVRLDDLSIR